VAGLKGGSTPRLFGDIVSFSGRRVLYFGRTADTHVEWFSGAR
jgi:hypothetical protein